MADESFLTRAGRAIGLFDSGASPIGKRGPAVPTQTLGTSRESYGDLSGIIWAPDRKLNLVGQHRWVEFDRLLRDVSIIAASVRLFLNLIANAVWTVNPPEGLNANEEPVAQEYADQAYNALYGMTSSWTQVVRKTAMFRLLGFSIMEWTAKRNADGTIGFLDVEHRPQRTIIRWNRDPSGTVQSVTQQIPGGQAVELPRGKIVYAVDDLLTDQPDGVGLFRHLAQTGDRLRLFLELEEIGFATDLRGIPIARAPLAEENEALVAAGPPGSEARDKADLLRRSKLQPLIDFVKGHIRNKESGMVLPSDVYLAKTVDGGETPSSVPKWALELLNGNSTAFDSMHQAVTRMNQELARVLGTEHLLLGADGSGSLALAQSKIGTFYMTVTSWLQDLVEVFDRDLIGPLADLNGWPDELRPEIGVNEINDRDIIQVTQALLNLANAGAVLAADDPAVGEVRDQLGLSRPDPEAAALDMSLNPNRRDPAKPLDTTVEPGQVAKRRVIRARKRRGMRRYRE